MEPQELIERIQRELQHRFHLAGRGSVTRVERQLNVASGYFRDQRRRGRKRRVELRVLLRALEALGVAPSDFFASVLGTRDAAETFCSEAAALRRRRKKLPQILVLVGQRAGSATRAGGGAADESPAVDVEALDAGCDDEPLATMRQAKALVPVADEAEVFGLLGVYASACRALGRFDEGQIVLAWALELAAERGDDRARADLLLRSAALVTDYGQHERALALTEEAILYLVSSGDEVGVARALIQQGASQRSIGRLRQAKESWKSALELLPEEAFGSAARARADVLANLESLRPGL